MLMSNEQGSKRAAQVDFTRSGWQQFAKLNRKLGARFIRGFILRHELAAYLTAHEAAGTPLDEGCQEVRYEDGVYLLLKKIKDLNAAVAKIALAQLTTANINNAEIDWASIGQLQADIAKLVNASIQTADIDWAQIKDLTAGTAIIEKGVNGKLYVADLAVTEANMASLTVGELIVKGADGCFYALSIAEDGTVTTEKKSVGDADIGDNSVSGGKLIEKTITARELNVASIFADEALVGAITAANIDVSSLFAVEAFIAQLNAVDISGNESLRLVVDAAKDEALDATGEAVAQIALTAEQIRSEVRRDYATADQVSQMNETLSTLAEQSENNFTLVRTEPFPASMVDTDARTKAPTGCSAMQRAKVVHGAPWTRCPRCPAWRCALTGMRACTSAAVMPWRSADSTTAA